MKWIPSTTIRMKALENIKDRLHPAEMPTDKNDKDGWMMQTFFEKKSFLKIVRKVNHRNIHIDFILQGSLVGEEKLAEAALILSTIAQKQWMIYPEKVPFVTVEQDWKVTRKSSWHIGIFELNKYNFESGACCCVGEPQHIKYAGMDKQFIFSSHAIDRILERCELPLDYPEITCCLLNSIRVAGFAMCGDVITARLELAPNPLTDIKVLGYSPIMEEREFLIGKTFLCPFMMATPGSDRLKNIPEAKKNSLKFDKISSLFSKAAISEVKKTGMAIVDNPTWCSWIKV